jgi:hypothetical protein
LADFYFQGWLIFISKVGRFYFQGWPLRSLLPRSYHPNMQKTRKDLEMTGKSRIFATQ